MYLKSLELQGFKSFADKISLEFHDGVTAVVGPNGSGKSNISDAIRWVLGEQSAKTLRGSKMEDVIFTGTEHRKAVGFAEVTLLMENSDRALPIDFNEVSVTRRVYRSGESEYLLNNTHCRLKDVYELFLDTGVGRDGYSIIGQGRIDEILSSKSEDRRNVFEEASGIMKYKVKKNEAERKLEHTTQNLLRINDIISELDLQLEPLEIQSTTAKKFLILRDELKDIEVSLFLQNIDRTNEKIDELIKLSQIQRLTIDSENVQLVSIVEENQVQTELNKEYEVKLEVLRKQFYEIEGESERFSSEIKVNEEKASNIAENIKRLDSEISDLSLSIDKTGNENDVRSKKLEYLKKQQEDFNKKLLVLESEYSLMIEGLSNFEKNIEIARALIVDKQDVLSDKKLQAGGVKFHFESLNKRQEAIVLEIHQNKLEIDKEGMLFEDVNDSIRKSKKNLSDNEASFLRLAAEKDEIQNKRIVLQESIEQTSNEHLYKSSRLKMLKDMESNLDGYVRSVKEILTKAKTDATFGEGVHGAYAQLIKVEKRFENAIEMALGNALQNIVSTDDLVAKRIIEYLKVSKLGRATFLPIKSIKGRRFEKDYISRMKKLQGFIDVAADLVDCNADYREITESLLGRVAVVDTFENARKFAKEFSNNVKIATLDGVIFNSGGSITGGLNEAAETGLVSRNREIPVLETEVATIELSLAKFKNELSEFDKQLKEVDQEIESGSIIKKNAENFLIRDESALKQITLQIEKLKSKNDLLSAESEALNIDHENNEIETKRLSSEIEALENEIEAIRKEIDDLSISLKAKTTQRQESYEDITNIKLSLNSILESIDGVKEAELQSVFEKEVINQSIIKKQAEILKFRNEIEKIATVNTKILDSIEKNNSKKTELQAQIDEISASKKSIDSEMSGIIEVINNKNFNIQLLQDDLNKIEIKKAKHETELEVILDKLWTDYELTTITAESMRREIPSVSAAQKRVNEIKVLIRELGPINVSAIEDFVKTKERFVFMSKQSEDLMQGKEKLQKVIAEMVQIMKKKFTEQFRLINMHFGLVFKELFNGGTAEIVISDAENILESGIDIIVQPPGKKLQNMMLLSGGEKALTAISLLFAILKMKPTPFCILDEIESALDESNVYRFGSYLKDFAKNTQFVIVTHRKGTMEVSDSLYGVTMQEHGVSKLVSLKINETSQF